MGGKTNRMKKAKLLSVVEEPEKNYIPSSAAAALIHSAVMSLHLNIFEL